MRHILKRCLVSLLWLTIPIVAPIGLIWGLVYWVITGKDGVEHSLKLVEKIVSWANG